MTHNSHKDLPLYIQSSHNTGYIEGWGLILRKLYRFTYRQRNDI